MYPNWDGGTGYTHYYTYAYSPDDGTLTQTTAPNTTWNLSYDGLKRLSGVQELNYDGNALMTHSYSYLAGLSGATTTLVSQLTTKKANGTTLYNESFTYDAVGNITGISGSAPASFTYDAQYQLTAATVGGVSYSYSYDRAGNIRSKTVGGNTVSYTYGDSEWADLLTKYGTNTISYDEIGNPETWYDGATMTWMRGRQLASISAVSGSHAAMSFTYDADGLRLTKTVGTGANAVEHKYTWQGGRLIAESWSGNTLEFYYDESGRPAILRYNGTLYYYVTNLQGDVVQIVDRYGTVYGSYSYDPFGKVLSVSAPSGTTVATVNPIRYRGYYLDSETGFYYLQSRYYDPNICRFINADGLASTGQGFIGTNMFAYCLNNPVNGADPSGCLPWYLDENGEGHKQEERHVIKYSVPLYRQGSTSLCWSISMMMRWSFDTGIELSISEAFEEAKGLAEEYHTIIGWNNGLPFYKQGRKVNCRNIDDLYFILLEFGPVYAAYREWTIFGGHIVLVTGVDLDRGYIYTNNPWGIKGAQFEGEFFSSFVNGNGKEEPGFWLAGIYIPESAELGG